MPLLKRFSRYLASTFSLISRCFFPGVRFVASFLLSRDVFLFKFFAWPPACALGVKCHSFSKDLIAISFERIDVYRFCFYRPKAAPSRFVTKYADLFVVPIKTHWRGSTTSLRP